jgi:hypothetical protein
MTEDEMAEEDQQGTDVLAIDREAWPIVVVQLDELFTVAETEGVDDAKAWLTVRGVKWRDLAPAPRRRLLRRPQRAPRPSRPAVHRLSPDERARRCAEQDRRTDQSIERHRARRAARRP